jgi:hypothetical protein
VFCQQLLIYFVCCSQEASIDQAEVFHRVVSSLCVLLSKDELVVLLHSCTLAACDKVKQSSDGSIQAIIMFIIRRGKELREADVLRLVTK